MHAFAQDGFGRVAFRGAFELWCQIGLHGWRWGAWGAAGEGYQRSEYIRPGLKSWWGSNDFLSA
jgi:hypothetical protein